MNRLNVSAALLLLFAASALAAAPPTAAWSRLASIDVPADAKGSLVEFPLTGDVFDAAGRDLSDLRIFDSSGAEIGYVLRLPPADVPDMEIKGHVFSRIEGDSLKKSVTLDFTKSVPKNRVEVFTSGDSFRRIASVESSDNAEIWHSLVDNATLMRKPATAGVEAYDRRMIAFAVDERRYLRVTVEPAPGDETSVRIEDVKCWFSSVDLIETVPVEVAAQSVTPAPDTRATEIALDLGWRRLPLWDMSIAFSDPNFFRRVRVYGRDSEKEIVRTPREDAPPSERTVEAPWLPVASTAIYRYTAGGRPDESLSIRLRPATTRYLKVVIANADDAALTSTGATVRRLAYYVQFPPKASMSYALYFGNQKAARPTYDLARYVDRLATEGVVKATLAASVDNPVKAPPKGLPWSERNKWVIWTGLIVALAVLVAIVVRQLRAAKDDSTPTPPSA